MVIGLGPGVTEFEVGDHISCRSSRRGVHLVRSRQQNLCDLGAHLMEPGMIDGTFRHHTSDGTTLTVVEARHLRRTHGPERRLGHQGPEDVRWSCRARQLWRHHRLRLSREPCRGHRRRHRRGGWLCGLGTAAIQGAKVAGAKNIVAIDRASSSARALEFGATHTAPSMEEPWSWSAAHRGRADSVIHAVGAHR